MQRTNIYLDDRQLDLLRRVGRQRSVPVSVLVREALNDWLIREEVQEIEEDEWQRRFSSLMDRRRRVATGIQPKAEQVEADVAKAVADVRRASAAGRR